MRVEDQDLGPHVLLKNIHFEQLFEQIVVAFPLKNVVLFVAEHILKKILTCCKQIQVVAISDP